MMINKAGKDETFSNEYYENFQSSNADNEDIASFKKVEGVDNVDKDKDAEATFERMMIARSKSAQ